MTSLDGKIIAEDTLQLNNRAFLFGDGVFETMKIVRGKIIFFEEHYFRLMAAMRIVRMEIPMSFTPEYLEEQILDLVSTAGFSESARARLTVFRNGGGFYMPDSTDVSFVINVLPLPETAYTNNVAPYEVDLYKDFHIAKHLLSTVKTTNKMINITASVYAKENLLQNCLLINESKNVVEAIHGNVFMLIGKRLVTPPLSEGCLNGIMRKQVLGIAGKMEMLEVVEDAISPFDLQKADEIFITNVITGVQSVSRYRKKDFVKTLADKLVERLNALILLN
ncbi:MAG TPA: aminotransferase class IV [Flavobacterium sp.]|jgi:branched-chain amino acid aminotransferase